ncbi:MFS transporter [Streptomyces sp. NPDC087440]|uniref:MFS transporter n=1 Tax=Streptomyces sp. NPDC087440 TaxID=3365790 RepID=UPI00382F6A09
MPVPRRRPVLTQRHVARLLVGTLIGRLPTGMAPVAIMLLVTGQGGTLAQGGTLCALYGLTAALGQPLLGRLVDRRGQTSATTMAVLVTTACLSVLPLIDTATQQAYAAAAVTLAGFSTPPLEANLRALWSSVLPDPVQRRAALALDTGCQGLVFIVGPPLVAVLHTAYGPATAMAVTTGLGLFGALLVLTARPSRRWRPEPDRRPAGILGPLRHRGLPSLLLALTGTGFALGALNVWAISEADAQGMSLLSGMIPAALSVGSLLGGALYGRRAWPGSLRTQLTLGASLFTFAWLPLVLTEGPLSASLLPLLPGLFLPVVITCSFLAIEVLAPVDSLTEAYAWLIAAVGIGQAAGTALAGQASAEPVLGAMLPAAGAVATLLVLLAARRALAAAHSAPRRGRHRRTAPGRHAVCP